MFSVAPREASFRMHDEQSASTVLIVLVIFIVFLSVLCQPLSKRAFDWDTANSSDSAYSGQDRLQTV